MGKRKMSIAYLEVRKLAFIKLDATNIYFSSDFRIKDTFSQLFFNFCFNRKEIGMTPAVDLMQKTESNKKSSLVKEKSNLHAETKRAKRKKPKTQEHVKSKRSKNKIDMELDHFFAEFSDKPKVPLQIQLDYARNGHSVLRSFLSPTFLSEHLYPLLLAHHHSSNNSLAAWQQKVQVAGSLPSLLVQNQFPTISSCKSQLKKMLQTPVVEIPFLQHFNTWRVYPLIEKLVTSPFLASSAATLLDVPSVRLYQDALFVKNLSKDGPTPWHSDAKMAPFDTSHMITFWIPLQHIPKHGGTGLRFVDKSHSDFALPFWNDENSVEYNRLEQRYSFDDPCDSNGDYNRDCVQDHMPLDLGDITVHAGWTLHCADAGNKDEKKTRTGGERYALAVSYVDARAEVREEYFENTKSEAKRLGDAEDHLSFRDWIGEVEPRKLLDHPLIPIVWPNIYDGSK